MRPSRWLPLLVGTWGIVTTLTGLVDSYSGLLAIRFFLGFCEGGILPGIVSVSGLWHFTRTLIFLEDTLPQHALQAPRTSAAVKLLLSCNTMQILTFCAASEYFMRQLRYPEPSEVINWHMSPLHSLTDA